METTWGMEFSMHSVTYIVEKHVTSISHGSNVLSAVKNDVILSQE